MNATLDLRRSVPATSAPTSTPGTRAIAIDVRRVTKRYGDASSSPALDGISLQIRDNEFFTLLGPSGCGKTTLLKMLAGFEQPSEGHILLFGQHLEGLPPNRRPVNTVFQHYSLFPHMTVAQNIAFGLKMLKRPASEIEDTVVRMLRLVKMERFANRLSGELSGGQQQRVALARALAPHPQVLLLDEPLSALDLKLRQAMRSELKQLQRDTGITFIFVTHDQEEALTMSDRIAVMSEGQVQQVATPLEIYEQPVNRFVADFIGETNLLAATVTASRPDGLSCRLPSGDSVDAVQTGAHAVGANVTLAVRPETLRLEPAGSTPAASGGLRGRVVEAIYMGTDISYRVQGAGDMVFNVRDRSALQGHRFNVGEDVAVYLPAAAVRPLAD